MGDWSIIEGSPKIVKIKGTIKRIFPEPQAPEPSEYYTVTLYPKKPKHGVFYLKFKTKKELDALEFAENKEVTLEGILRLVDGQKIVTNVRRSSEVF